MEVRGKYARPASNVSKLNTETDVLRMSEHPLLSRPVTAGSLIRKSFTDAALQVNLSRPPSSRSQTLFLPQSKPPSRPPTVPKPTTAIKSTPVSRPPSSYSRPQTAAVKWAETQIRSATASKETPERFLQLQGKEKVEEMQENEGEIVGDGGDVEQEIVEPVVEEPSRPPTATTWKTTSSQRRYIDELERLLREERKVRLT